MHGHIHIQRRRHKGTCAGRRNHHCTAIIAWPSLLSSQSKPAKHALLPHGGRPHDMRPHKPQVAMCQANSRSWLQGLCLCVVFTNSRPGCNLCFFKSNSRPGYSHLRVGVGMDRLHKTSFVNMRWRGWMCGWVCDTSSHAPLTRLLGACACTHTPFIPQNANIYKYLQVSTIYENQHQNTNIYKYLLISTNVY